MQRIIPTVGESVQTCIVYVADTGKTVGPWEGNESYDMARTKCTTPERACYLVVRLTSPQTLYRCLIGANLVPFVPNADDVVAFHQVGELLTQVQR
jgi:hypothetical protein